MGKNRGRRLIIALLLICLSMACQRAANEPLPSANAAAPVLPVAAGNTSNKEIVIAAAGDIMMGSTYPNSALSADDGAGMLSDVTPLLQAADISFGNLEGPMLEGGISTKCGRGSRSCFAFRVPPRYGKYLKEAGFDVMSLANNHASDFGVNGRDSTRKILDELGIAHAGSDTSDFAFININNRKIAFIAFATNSISYNLNDIEGAKKAVAGLVNQADIVVVSFHGGAEGATAQHVPKGSETFLGEARGNLRAFSHAVIDAGADLVIGHGPHVLRAMEIYQDRLIAYSLGNFAFHRFPFAGPSALSLVLEIKLKADGTFAGGKIHPLKQVGQLGPRIDKTGEAITVLRKLSNEDFGTQAVQIDNNGLLTASAK